MTIKQWNKVIKLSAFWITNLLIILKLTILPQTDWVVVLGPAWYIFMFGGWANTLIFGIMGTMDDGGE